MDAELLHALTDAVTASDRALVLTGTGSAFSAGVDLRRILDGGRPYTEEFLTALSRMFRAVFDHPRPTVAAVNGHAIAGGCVLALACDVRLMSGGRIGLAELAVGVPFPTSALEIVRHALGTSADRAVLRAETVGPERALALGMVDEVDRGPTSCLPRALAAGARELAARSRRRPTGWPRSGCTARRGRGDRGDDGRGRRRACSPDWTSRGHPPADRGLAARRR